MIRTTLCVIALVGVTALITSQAVSQEGGPKQPSPEEMKEMMEQWLALGKPGKPHAFFAQFEGKWDTLTRMWMAPGAPPMETEGAAEFKVFFGGRYLTQESASTMMGMPYQGMGITGYDNFKNRYEGIWIDNMSTSMLRFSGHLDRAGKVQTMYGEMDEPGLKLHGRMVKMVTRVVDDGKFVFEMYDLVVADDHKVFEIIYTRK